MTVKKSLMAVLAEYGIEIKKEGSVVRAFCPFHNDTGRPNFTIYEDTDSWYCFACKEGGDKVAFVAKHEGISYAAAKSRFESDSVQIQEIYEKNDGIDYEDEIITAAVELNILVSKMARQFLYSHPEKAKDVLAYLKTVDFQLLKPMAVEEIPKIIQHTSFIFKSIL